MRDGTNSVESTPQRVVKQRQKKTGYMQVCLVSEDGKKKYRLVHRLVGLAFIDNPESAPQINHKDCDKTNNDVSNLEWCTASENNFHRCQNHPQPHGVIIQRLDKDTLEVLSEYIGYRGAREAGYSAGSFDKGIGTNKVYRGFRWRKLYVQ